MPSRPAHPVVGLVGRKRAGKDAVADVLVREHGFTRIAFADPVREAALDLDPIAHVECSDELDELGEPAPTVLRLSEIVDRHGWEVAKDGFPEVRRTLQRLGTDVVRKRDPEFWTRRAEEAIRAVGGPVVLTDCRFPNEVSLIEELGGTTVRIVRPSVQDADDVHASEIALDGYETDVQILNDTSLDDLQRRADVLGRALIADRQRAREAA